MAEIKTQVKTFEIDQTCSECNGGRMRPTGQVLTSSPLQYPHKCRRCDEQKTFLKVYPYTVYERDEQDG